MDYLPFARVGRWTGEAWSALPDAPQIIEPQRRPFAAPMRLRAAEMLSRLAAVVSPAPASTIC